MRPDERSSTVDEPKLCGICGLMHSAHQPCNNTAGPTGYLPLTNHPTDQYPGKPKGWKPRKEGAYIIKDQMARPAHICDPKRPCEPNDHICPNYKTPDPGEDRAKTLPQDRYRLAKWLRELRRGERVTLDSLDLPSMENICAALLDPTPTDQPARGKRITHGRHCVCSSCAAEDWTNPRLAPCGMHGSSCPAAYAPLGRPGDPAPTDQGAEGLVRVELTREEAEALVLGNQGLKVRLRDDPGLDMIHANAGRKLRAALADEGKP